ncbi:MAG TPA: HAMP domain-containing sensor histidine kinase [Polyangiaceae bacterium]
MASKQVQNKKVPPEPALLLRQELATLRAKNATLQEKVRARDDFIAIVGHEMRNQMNAIQIQTDLILGMGRDSGVAPAMASRLEALQRATVGFMRRATAMLDVTRLTPGSLRLHLEEVELCGLVRDVLEEVQPLAERARCSIDVACDVLVCGIWDRLAIEQIVMNLVTNAIKYGAGKAIGVRVTCQGNEARLEVRDAGIGISSADTDRIFEPFERAVTRRQGGGFGLGLWISQHFVVAHRGSLDVKSYPGRGSVFTVTLPCALGEDA